MKTIINISEIEVENRQRKYFDEMKIVDLADSIEKDDLIHAPAVISRAEGGYVLVAGERRLRAIQLLHKQNRPFMYQGEIVPLDSTPVTFLSDRSLIAIKEAELAENLIRQDLTWQERVSAEKELHDLRLAQTDGKQTITATATEIKGAPATNQNITALGEDLFLAQNLDDPQIAKEKDRKRALALAKARAVKQKRAEMREKYQAEAQETKSPHKLIHSDFRIACAELEPRSFDLLLTDPPYGVDAGNFNDQFLFQHNYDDSSETWETLMTGLATLGFDLCKDKAHAYVFCDIRKWPKLAELFTACGWKVWDRPMIWDKGSIGALPRPRHGPRLCYEAILFASKGDKEVLRTGRDVLPYSNVLKERHAAEKPVDLFADLIGRTADAGSLILDPFCGSGTIFPAANRMACRAVGIEKEEEFYLVAQERLAE